VQAALPHCTPREKRSSYFVLAGVDDAKSGKDGVRRPPSAGGVQPRRGGDQPVQGRPQRRRQVRPWNTWAESTPGSAPGLVGWRLQTVRTTRDVLVTARTSHDFTQQSKTCGAADLSRNQPTSESDASTGNGVTKFLKSFSTFLSGPSRKKRDRYDRIADTRRTGSTEAGDCFFPPRRGARDA